MATKPTKLDWAYLAGLIDGDGSIFVSKRSNGTYRLIISVSNNNIDLIGHLQSVFDTGRAQFSSDNYTAYHVQWEGNPVTKILNGVLPYLVGKKLQAELALTFPLVPYHCKGMKHSELPPIREVQSKIYTQMRELNRKWSRGKVEGASR